VAQKEAELAVVQAQLAQAQAIYDALANGIPLADLALAEAQSAAAQVQLTLAQNNPNEAI
jgi:hypothetical protein